ncbi:hypothetical protein SETIT_6G117000v2 [Setaria italica]|uniref:Pentacotripeptide-repeat region of PRORP domain-containing protein n=1 Tax=Setaria italica TaxID=4555 RepID=A0A368RKV8_SETIT|nr:hypothetical protein SETIT_6G117000v2 [Setaria italica]
MAATRCKNSSALPLLQCPAACPLLHAHTHHVHQSLAARARPAPGLHCVYAPVAAAPLSSLFCSSPHRANKQAARSNLALSLSSSSSTPPPFSVSCFARTSTTNYAHHDAELLSISFLQSSSHFPPSFAFHPIHNLFDKMLLRGFPQDIVSYAALVEGLCETGRIDEALELFREMKRPDMHTYMALVKGLCGAGRGKEGLCMLQKMKELGWRPSTRAYAALVDLWCRERWLMRLRK